MISGKTLKIAGAAILGTLVGTSPAYAQISLADGKVVNPATFARETLVDDSTTSTVGGVKYHQLVGGSALDFDFKPDLVVNATETITVEVTLTNMVFGWALVADNDDSGNGRLILRNSSGVIKDAGTTTIRRGGTVGTNSVRFTILGVALAKDDVFTLEPTHLRVLPNMNGSISVTVSSPDAGSSTLEFPNAVRVVDAINDRAAAVSPTAVVSGGFQTFSGEATKAHVGSITLGVTSASPAIDVATGDDATRSNVVASAVVGFAGDISFVEDVFLSNAATCVAETFPLLTDADTKTWKTGSARPALSVFDTPLWLCIEVDGKTAIPATDAYTAVVDNTAVTNAVFPPPDTTLTLGSIGRDGTTVHIPYLTNSDTYNQRLVLRNRGSSAVGYSMTFHAEDGVTAVGGSDSSGMLQPGVTMLSLRNDDVVTITGGARTAATLNVVATPTSIGVATVLVNRNEGTTDTVVYQQ